MKDIVSVIACKSSQLCLVSEVIRGHNEDSEWLLPSYSCCFWPRVSPSPCCSPGLIPDLLLRKIHTRHPLVHLPAQPKSRFPTSSTVPVPLSPQSSLVPSPKHFHPFPQSKDKIIDGGRPGLMHLSPPSSAGNWIGPQDSLATGSAQLQQGWGGAHTQPGLQCSVWITGCPAQQARDSLLCEGEGAGRRGRLRPPQ